MSTPPRPTFLRHFGRRPGARRQPDLADMGTAFALDEVMDQPQYSSLPPGEMPEMRAPVRVAGWRLWLGRKLS
jgi:hypothetical protein